jgi:hypothetical protein
MPTATQRAMASGFAALSGSRPQHLFRRDGTFFLRVRVPDDVRALLVYARSGGPQGSTPSLKPDRWRSDMPR